MDDDVAAFLGDPAPQQKTKKKKKKRKKNKGKTPNKEQNRLNSPKSGAHKQRAAKIQKNHVRAATVCLLSICDRLFVDNIHRIIRFHIFC